MAYATTLASSLANGPSAGVVIAGIVDVITYGTFVKRDAATTFPSLMAATHLEVSPDDGTSWVVIPESRRIGPSQVTVQVGTGGQLRLVVENGGTGISINAKAAVRP
jgi:hypothetical protein